VYLKQKRFVYCELGVYFLNQQSLKGGIVGKVMEKLCTVKNNVFFFFVVNATTLFFHKRGLGKVVVLMWMGWVGGANGAKLTGRQRYIFLQNANLQVQFGYNIFDWVYDHQCRC
jgi:hypothetical protein